VKLPVGFFRRHPSPLVMLLRRVAWTAQNLEGSTLRTTGRNSDDVVSGEVRAGVWGASPAWTPVAVFGSVCRDYCCSSLLLGVGSVTDALAVLAASSADRAGLAVAGGDEATTVKAGAQ